MKRLNYSFDDLIIDGKPTDLAWEMAKIVSHAVVARYYLRRVVPEEDLESYSTLRLVEFLIKVAKNVETDPTQKPRNIFNVLYGMARWSCNNYLYKEKYRDYVGKHVKGVLSMESVKEVSTQPRLCKSEMIEMLLEDRCHLGDELTWDMLDRIEAIY